MSKARDLADLIAAGNPLADGAINVSEISDLTATAAEINKLDGLTATTAELNNVVGSTSSLQSQLDNISVTSGSLTKTFTNGESATITLSQSISPAPVVEVTKEVAQTGQSSKGAWDVNATASNYDLHNTAYATTLTPSSYISGATYNQAAAHDPQDLNPMGFDFKPDGTAYYVAGLDGDDITQWSVSTAWDLSTASGLQVFDISGYDSNVRGVLFNTDGTKMFILGRASQRVWPFALSTAWDISTASIINSGNTYIDFGTSSPNLGQTTEGFAFNDDGTKLYINDNGASNQSVVYQWDLTTAFDLSTASYANKSFSFHNDSKNIRSLFVDGDTVYIYNETDEYIYTYSFGTSGDISTLSATGVSFDVSVDTVTNRGLYVETTQNKLYLLDSGTVDLHEYDLTTTLQVALGTGSFASADVGKRIQGNGGDVILTSTAGAYDTTGGSDFTDTSTIASGSWTMHGLKSAGDADGLTIPNVINATYDVANAGTTSATASVSSPGGNKGFAWKNDGTKIFVIGDNSGQIYEYPLSTAYDLSTIGSASLAATLAADQWNGIEFNSDGTHMLALNNTHNQVHIFTMTTAWDLSTLSYYGNVASVSTPTDFLFSNDYSKVWIGNEADSRAYRHSFSTADDFTTLQASNTDVNLSAGAAYIVPWGMAWNGDGTKVFIMDDNNDRVYSFSVTTAYNLQTLDASTETQEKQLATSTAWRNIRFNSDGTKFYAMRESGTTIEQYDVGSFTVATSQYHIGVTNASGQIDSSTWLDINSMTADQSLGDGEAYYAVSTDDRTTWSVAKGSDGVRPIVRDNAGTWQYNTAFTTSYYGLANASYDNKSFSVSSQTSSIRETHFNTTGTKMYVISDGSDRIYEYDLSTAFDVSTATYNSANFSVLGQLGGAQGFCFNNNGTKMYVVGEVNDTVYQYSLSTAFDITTASYDSVSLSIGGQQAVAGTVIFNDDGTKMFICGESENYIRQYTLTTAFNVGTATAESTYLDHSTQTTSVTGMAFNDDGTKLFLASRASESVIYQYSLTTAYDVSTATYDAISFNVAPQLSATFQGIVFSNDGSKLYATDNSGVVLQYSTLSEAYNTSTTWTNATTNDEFYALQQALGATSVNRMDKTQLDAVADGSHFTLGNTLDLMIALKQDTASASLPTSDGVTINYDAEALNQGAVLGTDYDFDFPANNKVRITSNAAQNLKIRVV